MSPVSPPPAPAGRALWELTGRLTGVTLLTQSSRLSLSRAATGPRFSLGPACGTDEAAPRGARRRASPASSRRSRVGAGHGPRHWGQGACASSCSRGTSLGCGQRPSRETSHSTAPVLAAESSQCPADLSPKTDGGHASTVPASSLGRFRTWHLNLHSEQGHSIHPLYRKRKTSRMPPILLLRLSSEAMTGGRSWGAGGELRSTSRLPWTTGMK